MHRILAATFLPRLINISFYFLQKPFIYVGIFFFKFSLPGIRLIFTTTADRRHPPPRMPPVCVSTEITVPDVPANKSSASQREDEICFVAARTKMHICSAVDQSWNSAFPLRAERRNLFLRRARSRWHRESVCRYYNAENVAAICTVVADKSSKFAVYTSRAISSTILPIKISPRPREASMSSRRASYAHYSRFDGKSMFLWKIGCKL